MDDFAPPEFVAYLKIAKSFVSFLKVWVFLHLHHLLLHLLLQASIFFIFKLLHLKRTHQKASIFNVLKSPSRTHHHHHLQSQKNPSTHHHYHLLKLQFSMFFKNPWLSSTKIQRKPKRTHQEPNENPWPSSRAKIPLISPQNHRDPHGRAF